MRPLEEREHLETIDTQFLYKTGHVNMTANLPTRPVPIDFTEN